MIDEATVKQMLINTESDRIERTISTTDTDKFGEAICAFANNLPNHNQPGYLLIGVHDNGTLSGLQVTDQLLQNLAALRTDGNIIPPPALTVQKLSLPEGDLAIVEVHPHHLPPVRYKQRIWIRNGPRKAVAGEAEERILNEKRSYYARSFDALPCMGSRLQDLSEAFFRTTYLPAAIDSEELEANGRILEEQMASLKFYDLAADYPTNVGVLVFGVNPLYFLPGAYIQYVKYIGENLSDEVEYEKTFSGALITLLSELDDFIKNQVVHNRLISVSSLRERQLWDYPVVAIRESLMNAIMHRDYQSNAPIRFYEFLDRIEINNPGGLYGSARTENFPNSNDYRNPAIAEVMKVLGYVNRFNRGIARVKEALQKNNSPEPVYIINQSTYFSVTIPKNTDYENAHILQQ